MGVVGFLRRASFPEGWADINLSGVTLAGEDTVKAREWSESESELVRKGSKEFEVKFLAWRAKDWEGSRFVPSACEEGSSGGDGCLTLFRRPGVSKALLAVALSLGDLVCLPRGDLSAAGVRGCAVVVFSTVGTVAGSADDCFTGADLDESVAERGSCCCGCVLPAGDFGFGERCCLG